MATTFEDLLRMTPAQAARLWAKVEEILPQQAPPPSRFERFRDDPVGYAEEIGVSLWSKQKEILRSLLEPPHRTMVKSGHNLGKSFLAAVATCWWYDTRPQSVAITTAPTAKSVRDIIWREIRLLRIKAKLPGLVGTEMPKLKSGPDHYAEGQTAESGEAFQGRHHKNMLFVFDEAVGVPSIFWTTTNTMCKPGSGHAWLAVFNPTNTTTQAYQEEGLVLDGQPKWRTIQMSALDHPNIARQLRGEEPDYPAAVTLDQIWASIHEDCAPVTDQRRVTDFEFPPESGRWWRPNPAFQARWLGIWPEVSEGVWSDALWRAAVAPRDWSFAQHLPEIGCDVARYGSDWITFHVRWGNASVYHSRANGWKVTETAGELIRLAKHWAQERHKINPVVRPEDIRIKVDDDGVGGGVTDILEDEGYNVVPVNAGSTSRDEYPNVRSQLWFDTAERAMLGLLDLSRLPADTLARIRQQAMAPTWKMDAAGRRVVEKKEETKKKIGCSPDDMDGLNLAYHEDEDGPVGMPMILGTRGEQPGFPGRR